MNAAAPIARTISAVAAADVADDEVFVSDGTKCDTGTSWIFSATKTKLPSDPVYPVYVDTNVMAGHTVKPMKAGAYGQIGLSACKPSNGFIPRRRRSMWILFIFGSPINPTGAVAISSRLRRG